MILHRGRHCCCATRDGAARPQAAQLLPLAWRRLSMPEVTLSEDQWRIALAAVQGMQSQLHALVGPMADGGRPNSMAAVRVLGQLRWIEVEFRRAAGEV
jgi:hypothetical protein